MNENSNERPKSLSELRDEQRLARALPSLHDRGLRFTGADRQDDRDAERVRAARIASFQDWHLRARGREANEAEVREYLNEQGPDGAA